MSNITLPIEISFNDWASQIRVDLPNIDIPLPPDNEDEWIGWASQVVINNSLINVPLPTLTADPKLEDWQKWAAYFINSVSL